jgi:hypothetical protein
VILIAAGLIAFHPFIDEWINPSKVNTAVYIFLIALILGVLFLLLTERKRDASFSFSLTPDLRRSPVPNTISF